MLCLIFQGTCTGSKTPLLKTEGFTECAQLEVRDITPTSQTTHPTLPLLPMYISLYTIPKYTQHIHILNHHTCIKILCVTGGGANKVWPALMNAHVTLMGSVIMLHRVPSVQLSLQPRLTQWLLMVTHWSMVSTMVQQCGDLT